MNYILLRNFSFNFSVRLFAAPLVRLRGSASRIDKQFRPAFPEGINQEERRELVQRREGRRDTAEKRADE